MSTVTNMFEPGFLQRKVPFFEAIKKTAAQTGSEVYIVGGSVRDMLTGAELDDTDIVPFGAPYEDFARVLARNIKAPAANFKDNVRITKNKTAIDVSKPRGKDIREDLLSRDFTINNLACCLEGKIIGDKTDLENKTIRAVSPGAFNSDPLRLLRAFRFEASLGFKIEHGTAGLIREKTGLINLAAKERITEEIKKTFAGDFFKDAAEDENFIRLIQEIAPGCAVNMGNALRLKNFPAKGGNLFPIFLALLFEGKGSERFFRDLPLSSKDLKTILFLLKSEKQIDFKMLEKENIMRETAWRFYADLKTLTTFLQAKYPMETLRIKALENAAAGLSPEKALAINGNDLQKMGLKPSPVFSSILEDAKEKLALSEVDPENIKSYIMNKYIKNEGDL